MKWSGPKNLDIDHTITLKLESYEFVLFFATVLDNCTTEFLHQHAFYEIYYALDKTIQIKVMKEIITCRKHELLILAKNVEHQVLLEPNHSFSYFVCLWDLFPNVPRSFRGPDGKNEFDDIRNFLEQLDKKLFIHPEIPFDGNKLWDDIYDEWKNRRLAWNSTLCFKLYEFVIKSLRHAIKSNITDKTLAGIPNYGLAASKFIHMHFTEPITLEDVAKHINVSPRHINRAYMQIYDSSIMRNLNKIRIEYAKRYLCLTDYSIEKIAEIVGFTSTQTLYKLFKRYVGITVSQYRNKKHCMDIDDIQIK
jgi:AraC-like DNA-binding protein